PGHRGDGGKCDDDDNAVAPEHDFEHRIAHGRSVDDAGPRDMEIREMGMRVREVQLDSARRIRPAAPSFRQREFEPVRQIDPRPMLLLGNRINNGLSARIYDTWNDVAHLARLDVYVELDFRKDGIV